MSGRSSPVNGGYEAARLTVRKDLFPEVRLPKLASAITDASSDQESDSNVSCVKLETDFEQSIDDIANQKLQVVNGVLPCPTRPRHRKHKHHSRQNSDASTMNGCLPPKTKRRKDSKDSSYRKHSKCSVVLSQVKGGKNLNLVSSSECPNDEDNEESAEEEPLKKENEADESESSEDEKLNHISKLPLTKMLRQSGKPYSHELSQLSTKKSKKAQKEHKIHAVIPCSGKPRSMMDICSSRSKKKSTKSESTTTYRSQIMGTHSIKIKIKRTNVHETVTPTPTSIADIGLRKSKKKRTASPVSVSSGEEYDPSRGDTAAAMSVAAPKPRNALKTPKTVKTPKTKKINTSKSKKKSEKTERTRISGAESKESGPQSPWGRSMPKEILLKIFEHVVASQGALPSMIRIGRVCKLWHSVSCRPELWKNVDLAQYTSEKCKTDYKLVWLLENRLAQCQILNIAQWKVSNVSWVLACVADYCPDLVELSVAGWSRITPEQLFDLVQALPKLQRIDLSVTSETGGSSTCLSAASMARISENFGARLTHLTLANNKFVAMPQILQSIAAHCCNLEVLDISGTLAASHPAAVPLEALQKGCPKMRVFRAANSQLVLQNATTSQQMECAGWTALEELSIAGEAAAERVGVGEYRLSDDALARLVRGATRLRLLDVRGLQRLTDSGLVRVPAWDLQHLFLGGCNVTRKSNACLELICEKWSHSLIELDLSWASATRALNDAVAALADEANSKLRILNLCGSSISLEPVKTILLKCPNIESLNLSSCRALPRGMKRLYTGQELLDLKDSLDPEKSKAKDESDDEAEKSDSGDSKSNTTKEESSRNADKSDSKLETSKNIKSPSVFQEPKSISGSNSSVPDKQSPTIATPVRFSPDKLSELITDKEDIEIITPVPEGKRSTRNTTPKLLSPTTQSRPDSSSTPRSESIKGDLGSPHFSPVPKPDSQVQNSPEIQSELLNHNPKSNSWNLGQFKTTPTNKSEASPLSRLESHNKLRHGKVIEQCSPTTSHDNKPSPETHSIKQDSIKNPNNWNYGNYSPMPRQENQFSSQRSPYSAQPSPAQPSPYSTQPSPYSTQPSPYSSQPSPYSAQPSPDTSQIVKPDIQKTNAWNTGNYSPMPKHHQPFSPHPSTHASPDPGIGIKTDPHRSNPNKTPGQYSPMSRQDRLHQSPYSPRPSVDVSYSNKKSPGVGNYSPMMRQDCHLPSPDRSSASRPTISGRAQQDLYGRSVPKAPDILHNNTPTPDLSNSWGMDRFNQICSATTPSIESLVWGTPSFSSEPAPPLQQHIDNIPSMLNTPSPQSWPGLPSFDSSVRRHNDDLSDPWTSGQFREQPYSVHNSFVEQTNFELSSLSHQAHSLQSFLDDSFTETSRVD